MAYIAILLVVLLSLACNVPYIYEVNETKVIINECAGYWRIPQLVVREDNSTYVPSRYLPGYRTTVTIVSVLTFYVIPTIILIFCNALIIKSLKSTPKVVKLTKRCSQRFLAENKCRKVAIAVSICFMIFNLPNTVTHILWGVLPTHIVEKIQPIAHLFLMINVGVNIVIYSVFNKFMFSTAAGLGKKCCNWSKAERDVSISL